MNKQLIIVPDYVSADDANRLYGEQFGVDWKYEAITADTLRKLSPRAHASQAEQLNKAIEFIDGMVNEAGALLDTETRRRVTAFIRELKGASPTAIHPPAQAAQLWEMKQRACRAHALCNELRLAHPEIPELGDDGVLHEAIHDILRVDTPTAAPAQAAQGDNDPLIQCRAPQNRAETKVLLEMAIDQTTRMNASLEKLHDTAEPVAQGEAYSPLSIPDDAPDKYAQAYIRDWCPDHVKAYIARLTVPADRPMNTLALEQMADDLQAIIDGERPRLNKTEMRECARGLRAAAQPRALSDGMVLVPREPTLEMAAAGMVSPDVGNVTAARCYRAMLAAAPSQGEPS